MENETNLIVTKLLTRTFLKRESLAFRFNVT